MFYLVSDSQIFGTPSEGFRRHSPWNLMTRGISERRRFQ
mgnify:CR=1 FL=1